MEVSFESILVFTPDGKKCFFTKFNEGINIIKGKNTSGKSTLIQSIIYALGINDEKDKLKEILVENVFFRLDLKLNNNGVSKSVTFIRNEGVFFIISEKNKIRFDGIDSNNSNEHIKLKNTISEIFGFNLCLERDGQLKEASLEVMMLPYYVSQSVGWVYLRESFSGLNFYKNFKEDYLDYFLGITKNSNRMKINALEKNKNKLQREVDFFQDFKDDSVKLIVSEIQNEVFSNYSVEYLNECDQLYLELIDSERKYLDKCNKKSLLINRRKILGGIKRNLDKQKPGKDSCPVCSTVLSNSLENIYCFYQDKNDTDTEYFSINGLVKNLQSEINSLEIKINKLKLEIHSKYLVLNQRSYGDGSLSYSEWLDSKASLRLKNKIDDSILLKRKEIKDIECEVQSIDVDDPSAIRVNKERLFLKYFESNLRDLRVKQLSEDRYKLLYRINSFPYQGVELHKTVMAYHFALNKLIQQTKGIHRFPFLLDAVMKEDIEVDNRVSIFNFINKNCPNDVQTIFSISESLLETKGNKGSFNIEFVNENYFYGKARIIQIGDGDSERAFLQKTKSSLVVNISETFELIDTIL